MKINEESKVDFDKFRSLIIEITYLLTGEKCYHLHGVMSKHHLTWVAMADSIQELRIFCDLNFPDKPVSIICDPKVIITRYRQ